LNRDRRIPRMEFRKEERAADSEGWELWLNMTVQFQGRSIDRFLLRHINKYVVVSMVNNWIDVMKECDLYLWRSDATFSNTRSYLSAHWPNTLRRLNRINIRLHFYTPHRICKSTTFLTLFMTCIQPSWCLVDRS
jgi:hypothetical protein